MTSSIIWFEIDKTEPQPAPEENNPALDKLLHAPRLTAYPAAVTEFLSMLPDGVQPSEIMVTTLDMMQLDENHNPTVLDTTRGDVWLSTAQVNEPDPDPESWLRDLPQDSHLEADYE